MPLRVVMVLTAVLALRELWNSGGSIQGKVALALLVLALISSFARSINDVWSWTLYVIGFIAFVQLRTFADETGITHQASYPILLDRLLFLGELPTAWLQEHIHPSSYARPLEILLAATYVSYFLMPHVVGLVTWRLRPALFPRVPLAIVATLHIGLLFYFALPTVPPWLAHEYGEGPELSRVLVTLTQEVDKDGYEAAARVAGANDVGAMPSLHMALTVLVALVAAEFGRVMRYLGAAYVALMGLALVYLGEHYVADLAAGALIAIAVWSLSTRWSRSEAGAMSQSPSVIDSRPSAVPLDHEANPA